MNLEALEGLKCLLVGGHDTGRFTEPLARQRLVHAATKASCLDLESPR